MEVWEKDIAVLNQMSAETLKMKLYKEYNLTAFLSRIQSYNRTNTTRANQVCDVTFLAATTEHVIKNINYYA